MGSKIFRITPEYIEEDTFEDPFEDINVETPQTPPENWVEEDDEEIDYLSSSEEEKESSKEEIPIPPLDGEIIEYKEPCIPLQFYNDLTQHGLTLSYEELLSKFPPNLPTTKLQLCIELYKNVGSLGKVYTANDTENYEICKATLLLLSVYVAEHEKDKTFFEEVKIIKKKFKRQNPERFDFMKTVLANFQIYIEKCKKNKY